MSPLYGDYIGVHNKAYESGGKLLFASHHTNPQSRFVLMLESRLKSDIEFSNLVWLLHSNVK